MNVGQVYLDCVRKVLEQSLPALPEEKITETLTALEDELNSIWLDGYEQGLVEGP